MMPPEIVWVVSFAVDEEGQFLDYAVEEFNLTQCTSTVAGHLRELMGKGVFDNFEAAEHWAKKQTQGSCCHNKNGACLCSKSNG